MKASVPVTCEACNGRGWTAARAGEWPARCARCHGRGGFTLYSLGKMLLEDPRTVTRLLELRSGRVVGERVINRLASLGFFADFVARRFKKQRPAATP